MMDTEIYEVTLSDGSITPLTHTPEHGIAETILSPNGKYLAYTIADLREGYPREKLEIRNRDGSQPRVLADKLDRRISAIQWDKKSNGIYFLYSDHGSTKLAHISLSGKFRKLAENLGNQYIMSYSSGQFHVGPRHKVVFTGTRPDNPADLLVGDTRKSRYRQITFTNRDLLAHKTLGKVEEIWYKSAFDGRSIQGWIITPPDFDPARKYPLILEIHGGPHADYGSRFDFEKQLMAARGYVVLYTNPRGSIGYGREFRDLIYQAYPGNDYHDLNSGVNALLEKGYIDPENLFVTGGSGGGILTCWMIGQTRRFRAAVTLYPLINWYSSILTMDLSTFMMQYFFSGFPWEHPSEYHQRSPISLVKQVKTPTMILTGEQDYRTPISESEQYYQALKLLNVESVLVRVPEAAHGIFRRPSHWMAKMLYIIEWFEKHQTGQKRMSE